MPLPPAPRLAVSDADRKELMSLSRQRSIPRGILLRVNIVPGAAEGRANHVLARELSTTVTTVLLWRNRYVAEGLAGLFSDRPRSGRPKQVPAAEEAAIVEATMKTVPRDATHWSVRAMDASQKVSPATVLRIWKNTSCSHIAWNRSSPATIPISSRRFREYIRIYSNNPRPFQWVASASRIIRKVNKYRQGSEANGAT
jgi:Homeodomain-like domain